MDRPHRYWPSRQLVRSNDVSGDEVKEDSIDSFIRSLLIQAVIEFINIRNRAFQRCSHRQRGSPVLI